MPWIVAMDWTDALFLHWPVEPLRLRDRLPRGIELDTFDGAAWVSVVAFRLVDARPRGVPRALAWRTFPEVNVRTYVVRDGHPAVWFFSLDADSRLAVQLGRRGASLPYQHADARIASSGEATSYRFDRRERDMPPARFDARSEARGDARPAAPGTLDRWLVERLSFFTLHAGRVRRLDVAHAPWLLRAPPRVDDRRELAALRGRHRRRGRPRARARFAGRVGACVAAALTSREGAAMRVV